MRKEYYKDGVQVARPKSLVLNGNTYIPPTDEQLVLAGYEIREVIDPIPEPQTKEEQFKWRVVELIRERYDLDSELAIQRQRESKPQTFEEYNDYCEQCKEQAHSEIYREEG